MAGTGTALAVADGMYDIVSAVDGMADIMDDFAVMASRSISNITNVFSTNIQMIQPAITGQQIQFNNTLSDGEKAATGLWKAVSGMIGRYANWDSVGKILKMADSVTRTTAKLNAMNSTMANGMQNAGKLQDMVAHSAQATGTEYRTVADTVALLGTAASNKFANSEEIVRFADLMSKSFSIGGASREEKTSGMEDMAKMMGSGSIDSEELDSMIEKTPVLSQAIEDYMVNVRHAEGSMKDWKNEGLITSDVIKSSLFSAGNEIDSKFSELPKTWEQVGSSIKTAAIEAFTPALEIIGQITQEEGFQNMVNNLVTGLNLLGAVAGEVIGQLAEGAVFIFDNWSIIAPILLGVAAAVLFYTLITQGATAATAAWGVAQQIQNAIMAMSPLSLIIVIVMILIGVFYAVIGVINKVTGSSYSATGLIAGAFMWLAATVGNIFISLGDMILNIINYIAGPFFVLANFISNCFKDPISSVIYLFQGMADVVLRMLQKIAEGLDFVFQTNMAGTIQGFRNGLKEMADNVVKMRGHDPEEFLTEIPELSMKGFGINKFDANEQFHNGYQGGKGFADGISNFNPFDTPGAADYLSAAGGMEEGAAGDVRNTEEYLCAIADNTGKTADSMEISEEDLKYMRDIAEREIIDRTVFSSISVEMGGVNNNVQNMANLDGIGQYLADSIQEQMAVCAEGVH